MTISDNLMITMTKMGKAIEKGAIEDIKSYLQSCDTITMNGLPGVRADKINTNLSKMVASENVEIKMFSRSSWKGFWLSIKKTKHYFLSVQKILWIELLKIRLVEVLIMHRQWLTQSIRMRLQK